MVDILLLAGADSVTVEEMDSWILPQVIVLIVGGAVIGPFVKRVGLDKAAWLSAGAVVCALAVYGLLRRFGYLWVAVVLVLGAVGMRVVGVVAGTNVMRGLPRNRTTIGAALVDTASEVTTGIGIAVSGTILAALFTGRHRHLELERPSDCGVPRGDVRWPRTDCRSRGARRMGHRPCPHRRPSNNIVRHRCENRVDTGDDLLPTK